MNELKFTTASIPQLNQYVQEQLSDRNWENLRPRHLALKDDVSHIMKKLRERNMHEWTSYDEILLTNLWRIQACRRFKVHHIGCVYDHSIFAANDTINIFTSHGRGYIDFNYPLMEQAEVLKIKRNLTSDHRFRIFRALEHKGRSIKNHVIRDYKIDWDNNGCDYEATLHNYPILKILPDVMAVYINNIVGNRWSPVNRLFNAHHSLITDCLALIDDRNKTDENEYKAIYDAIMIYMTTEFIFQLYGEIICNCPNTEPPGYRVLVLNYILKFASGIPLPGKYEYVSTWLHNIFDPCLNIISKRNSTLFPFCKDIETVTRLGSYGDEKRIDLGYYQDSLLMARDISHEQDNTLDYIWGMILRNQRDGTMPETARFSPAKSDNLNSHAA